MIHGLVSIIMPAYNSEAYIANTLKSILAQTYPDWELIIVDDCSTDKTVDIINSLGDSRFKLIRNEVNSGAAVSRNRALKAATGKWIAFQDSDDIWHPEKLERQINFMIENKYSFSCTDYRIQLNGKWLPYVNNGPLVVNKKKMYDYCYFSTITVMYDREIVGLIQIENLRKNNDYAMWLQIIEKSKCYRLSECLSFYIKHEGSISSGNKTKLVKWHYLLFREGQHRSPIIAVLLTFNNLYHGVIKKLKYKRKVTEKDEIFCREAEEIAKE